MTDHSHHRHRAWMAALLALPLLLVGCNNFVTPTGIWGLRTVDGQNLPVVLENEGGVVTQIDRGLLFVRVEDCIFDATYSSNNNGTPLPPEQVALQCEWFQTDEMVDFVWSGTDRATAVIDGDFIRMTYLDGREYAFERVGSGS